MTAKAAIQPGSPAPLGATARADGTNFALFSANATKVEVCLFSSDGKREVARHALEERTGDVWHGFIPGVINGQLYGYRVHGPYAPKEGHRFNPNKLLIDPNAKRLFGRYGDTRALLGYDPDDPKKDLSFSKIDSAPHMPKCVVGGPPYRWRGDKAPATPMANTVLYETHVKGQTMRHSGVPKRLRGTFEGLSSPAMLDHLSRLGVTAVELLPVQSFFPEPRLTEMGLTNYWGYNPINYFAPHTAYMGPAGEQSFLKMVQALHGAGVEVILDVVYNHTAESWELGPTLSYRGIDNASYYRLKAGNPRLYENETGCGNALRTEHPAVLALVMESLRYWVDHMHVDGFRFDLATTIARTKHGFDAAAPLLSAIRQDPILSQVKLIMEPWDVGSHGYQLGNFPAGMPEWNDRYRDSVRSYWRADKDTRASLAGALLGSADVFDKHNRRPHDSLNFITSHDGFNLTDLVSFNHKHNQANGEGNRDGHGHNLSDNCGTEGPSDDALVLTRRARRKRNLLATLMLSQGTPMLLAGDEMGHSQQGNNNAYCQDNEITWLDWDKQDIGLMDFVAGLIKLRADEPLLRQKNFLHSREEVDWLDASGHRLDGKAWHGDAMHFGCMLKSDGRAVLILMNSSPSDTSFSLPDGFDWSLQLNTAVKAPFSTQAIAAKHVDLPAETLLLLKGTPHA